jgi:hypothetical protein
MSKDFEVLHLYYMAWQEGELSLAEMREFVIDEIGRDGLERALEVFKSKRLEREGKGINKTLYDYTKPKIEEVN